MVVEINLSKVPGSGAGAIPSAFRGHWLSERPAAGPRGFVPGWCVGLLSAMPLKFSTTPSRVNKLWSSPASRLVPGR